MSKTTSVPVKTTFLLHKTTFVDEKPTWKTCTPFGELHLQLNFRKGSQRLVNKSVGLAYWP